MGLLDDAIKANTQPSSTANPTTPQPPTATAQPVAASGGSLLQQAIAENTKPDTDSTTTTTPPVGPNGQPNPRNVYAATDEESTPEGAAAAIARREGQHPILSGIGQGTESLLQPVFHPIDTVENIVKQSLPPFQVYDAVKKAYPLIQTYENARSSGKSVWQSISATNDYAKKQDEASQAVEKAIADYKKNPTQTTAKLLTEVAGNVAMLAAGGSGATAEADVPLVTRAAETEAPVAETEAETSAAAPKPGIIKQVLQGDKVAQEPARAALKTATGAAQETPLRESLTAPIGEAEKSADALYKQIDDASGTDFKGLGKKLKDVNVKIRMSTNPTDEAAWEAKRSEIEDTLAEAKQKATDAGVDPKTLERADAQFKKMSALTDVEKKVFKNVNVVDPTTDEINVNAAVKELQKLQDSEKYGSPRLEQAFGKDSSLLEDMKAANRLGIKALKRKDVAKMLLKYGGLGGAGYEVAKKIIE